MIFEKNIPLTSGSNFARLCYPYDNDNDNDNEVTLFRHRK